MDGFLEPNSMRILGLTNVETRERLMRLSFGGDGFDIGISLNEEDAVALISGIELWLETLGEKTQLEEADIIQFSKSKNTTH